MRITENITIEEIRSELRSMSPARLRQVREILGLVNESKIARRNIIKEYKARGVPADTVESALDLFDKELTATGYPK